MRRRGRRRAPVDALEGDRLPVHADELPIADGDRLIGLRSCGPRARHLRQPQLLRDRFG